MNKGCAETTFVLKTPLKKTKKQKNCWCHFHFPQIAVLFDVQIKPCSAPCYLAGLKAVVSTVIVVLKRKWLADSTKNPKKKEAMLFTAMEHGDAPVLKLRWNSWVCRIKQSWLKLKKKTKHNLAQKVCVFHPFRRRLTFFKVWQRRGAAYLHCAPFPKAASITVD